MLPNLPLTQPACHRVVPRGVTSYHLLHRSSAVLTHPPSTSCPGPIPSHTPQTINPRPSTDIPPKRSLVPLFLAASVFANASGIGLCTQASDGAQARPVRKNTYCVARRPSDRSVNEIASTLQLGSGLTHLGLPAWLGPWLQAALGPVQWVHPAAWVDDKVHAGRLRHSGTRPASTTATAHTHTHDQASVKPPCQSTTTTTRAGLAPASTCVCTAHRTATDTLLSAAVA